MNEELDVMRTSAPLAGNSRRDKFPLSLRFHLIV
jgi:hypothetical protein